MKKLTAVFTALLLKRDIFVVDWYKDAQPRAYVKSTIEEILDMNLPSGYDKEIFMQKTDMLM
ncbi:MAG: hypothetical protein IJQ78_08015, partial [Selenomonadaceae bacterium]|nr:hypothetical protein [Selenomonadaceae bacterium]